MYGPFPPCANKLGISTFGVSNASHAGNSQVYGPEPKPEREIKETEASTRIQHASNAHKIKLERPLREYNPLARGSVEESDDDACSSNSSGYDEEVRQTMHLSLMSVLCIPSHLLCFVRDYASKLRDSFSFSKSMDCFVQFGRIIVLRRTYHECCNKKRYELYRECACSG
jgi:hypothetical protein